MKIRTGFVSNSSSTSFTLTIAEDTYNNLNAYLNDEELKIIYSNLDKDHKKLFDKLVVNLSYNGWDLDEIDGINIEDLLNELVGKLKDNNIDYILTVDDY